MATKSKAENIENLIELISLISQNIDDNKDAIQKLNDIDRHLLDIHSVFSQFRSSDVDKIINAIIGGESNKELVSKLDKLTDDITKNKDEIVNKFDKVNNELGGKIDKFNDDINKGNDKLVDKLDEQIIASKDINDSVNSLTGITSGAAGGGGVPPIGTTSGSTSASGATAAAVSASKKQQKKHLEKLNHILDTLKAGFNVIKNGFTKSYQIWTAYDHELSQLGRNLGMNGNQINAFHTSRALSDQRLAYDFGLKREDITKFNETYSSITKRFSLLNDTDTMDMASMEKMMSPENAKNLLTNFDRIGGSIDSATAWGALTMERAKKMGLNAKEASGIFAKNMSMVNKYHFKNGVDGISKMALLSQRLKFNFESISGLLDKVSDFEGAIDVSARMQMLGGSYASSFGNPLDLMYEGLNDAEGIMQRLVDMTKSKGTFNKETGTVDISAFNKRIMKEAAKNLGVDYEEVMNMVNSQAQLESASRDIKGNFKQADKDKLASMAKYSAESGWTVSYMADGEMKHQKLNEIKPEDMAKINEGLIPDDLEDVNKSILIEVKSGFHKLAKETTSLQERVTGFKTMIATFWDRLGDLFFAPFKNFISPEGWGGQMVNSFRETLGGDNSATTAGIGLGVQAIGAMGGTYLAGKGFGRAKKWASNKMFGNGTSTGTPTGTSGGGSGATPKGKPSKWAVNKARKLKVGKFLGNAGKVLGKAGGLAGTIVGGVNAISDFTATYKAAKEGDKKQAWASGISGAGNLLTAIGGGLMLTGVGAGVGAALMGIGGLVSWGANKWNENRLEKEAQERENNATMIANAKNVGLANNQRGLFNSATAIEAQKQDENQTIRGDFAMNGKIKLEMPNGSNIDVSALLNNPSFRNGLLAVVNEQKSISNNGGTAPNRNTTEYQKYTYGVM